MRGVDRLAVGDDRRVDSSLAERHVPDLFSRPRFECVDPAVGAAVEQKRLSSNVSNDRSGVGCVVGLSAGLRYPDNVSRRLVERYVAMAAAPLSSPTRVDTACYYKIFKNDRSVGSPSVGGYLSELLGQWVLPEKLAVAIQTEKRAASTQYVDALGGRIHHGRGPADAVRRDIAAVDVEAVLPDGFACIGIEAHDLLLLGFSLPCDVNQVKPVSHHYGSRSTANGDFPHQVLAFWRPCGRQPCFLGNAVLNGSAPVGPDSGQSCHGGRQG